MAIPAYLWLKDDGGASIKGASKVAGREGSIEVLSFGHGLSRRVDGATGMISGGRVHSSMTIEKEFDASSPYLYRAVATGQALQSAELRWYRVNEEGSEKAYFSMLLEKVKVVGIHPGMPNIKFGGISDLNPFESVSLRYERITWRYLDGNIAFTDAWDERW